MSFILAELIENEKDPISQAELRLDQLGFKTFNWFDVLKWNELVIKFLSNDYFPLLRTDDLPDCGDRICPMHALDLLLQKEDIDFRDRILTEEEFDHLEYYRKSIDDIAEYAIVDLGQRKKMLAKKLNFTPNARKYLLDIININKGYLSTSEIDSINKIVKDYDDISLHDVFYIQEGKSYQPEVFQKVLPEKTHLRDRLPWRMPKTNDVMKLVKPQTVSAFHPRSARLLEVGDEITVSRCSLRTPTETEEVIVWYWRSTIAMEQFIPLDCLETNKFNIKIPEGFGRDNVYKLPAKANDFYRPKFVGLNAYGNVLAHDYLNYGFRVTPKHLADIIALRYLDIITSQQAKVLLDRCWDNFGWYDVIYHIRELKMLENTVVNLREIIENTLKDQEQAVQDYKGGKKAAFGRLMGASMKACEGRAKPNDVRILLEEILG